MAGRKGHSGGVRDGAGAPTKEGRSDYKTRNWATVVYPESAPDGWRDTLRSWCVQALVSPLHDEDKDPTGDAKKPHWHVLVMYDGPRTRRLVQEQFGAIGGVGCVPCNSARGYARYLCHLDNPDKAQYNPETVEEYGGASYLDVIELQSDRRQVIGEMCAWCRQEGCISFATLCDYARQYRPTWWQAITSHSTMVMVRYLMSMEAETKHGAYMSVAPDPASSLPEPSQPQMSELDKAKVRARNLELELAGVREAIAALERKPDVK